MQHAILPAAAATLLLAASSIAAPPGPVLDMRPAGTRTATPSSALVPPPALAPPVRYAYWYAADAGARRRYRPPFRPFVPCRAWGWGGTVVRPWLSSSSCRTP